MPEQWKDIDGYEGSYQVSDLGQVRSLDRVNHVGRKHKGRILSQAKCKGYDSVGLSKNRNRGMKSVHRLVAVAFLGPIPEGKIVLHGPGGRSDNSVSNLSYGTPRQNNLDMFRDGTGRHRAVIRSDGKIFDSLNIAAEQTGLKLTSGISDVCRGYQKTAGGFGWAYYLDKPEITEHKEIDGERWKDVVGYEELYQISDMGRVRSLGRVNHAGRKLKGRILSQAKCNGYLLICLLKNRKRNQKSVHRLVAEAFLGPVPEGNIVRHGPGGSSDNSVSNLSYGTRSENSLDMFRDGTGRHKAVIRSDGKVFASIKLATEQTGLKSAANISDVCRGVSKTAGGFGWAYYSEGSTASTT